MLGMTQTTPSPQSNTEVETLCFRVVFLLKVQDDSTTIDGDMFRKVLHENLLKKENESGLQNDNDPRHNTKATKEWIKKKQIKVTQSGLASVQKHPTAVLANKGVAKEAEQVIH